MRPVNNTSLNYFFFVTTFKRGPNIYCISISMVIVNVLRIRQRLSRKIKLYPQEVPDYTSSIDEVLPSPSKHSGLVSSSRDTVTEFDNKVSVNNVRNYWVGILFERL